MSFIQLYEVIIGIVLICGVSIFLVSCFCDLKVNLSTMRTVKKLEERVTALEQGSDSDV